MCNPQSNYWPGKERRPGSDMRVTSADGSEFNVRISRPAGEPPFPTVLIIHDYYDPEGYYFDLAEQYAAAGYLGVCPELFHRQEKLAEQTPSAAGARIGSVADDQVFADVDAVCVALRAEGLLGDLAITGFCWGGRMSYLLAARHPELRLLLPFYGHLVAFSGPDGNKPYSPLDEASRIRARVVGSYGGADDAIPVDQVEQMEALLRSNGLSAELKVYPGAPHCFFRTPEFSAQSDDAWARVLAALGETMAPAAT